MSKVRWNGRFVEEDTVVIAEYLESIAEKFNEHNENLRDLIDEIKLNKNIEHIKIIVDYFILGELSAVDAIDQIKEIVDR